MKLLRGMGAMGICVLGMVVGSGAGEEQGGASGQGDVSTRRVEVMTLVHDPVTGKTTVVRAGESTTSTAPGNKWSIHTNEADGQLKSIEVTEMAIPATRPVTTGPATTRAAVGEVSFYGIKGEGMRVVYILDHSGSMLDNFDFLKQEMNRSIGGLRAEQMFNVVMVSEEATVVGGKGELMLASAENVKKCGEAMKEYRAQGTGDQRPPSFLEGFEMAFKMKPEVIYFLADGYMDPKVGPAVKKLNVEKKVKVHTVAFVIKEPTYEKQLKELAEENGGVYRFVAEKELHR